MTPPVRRFESGTILGIITRVFNEIGVQVNLVARTYPSRPKYRLNDGKPMTVKELMQAADKIRREKGLEPLWHEPLSETVPSN